MLNRGYVTTQWVFNTDTVSVGISNGQEIIHLICAVLICYAWHFLAFPLHLNLLSDFSSTFSARVLIWVSTLSWSYESYKLSEIFRSKTPCFIVAQWHQMEIFRISSPKLLPHFWCVWNFEFSEQNLRPSSSSVQLWSAQNDFHIIPSITQAVHRHGLTH